MLAQRELVYHVRRGLGRLPIPGWVSYEYRLT